VVNTTAAARKSPLAQAVPSLHNEKHPAILRNADLAPDHHIQAIAHTAGSTLPYRAGWHHRYPSLAQRVTDPVILRILLSIGPTETAHFQTWHDKAGNAPALTDPKEPQLGFFGHHRESIDGYSECQTRK
jgi:hypothetical protein